MKLAVTIFIILRFFSDASWASDLHIGQIIDYLATNNTKKISGKRIINKNLILSIYNQNNHNHLWPNDYIAESVEILRNSRLDGLLKKDYHYFKLIELMNLHEKNSNNNSLLRAEIDILLTDGILTYQYHLMNGKLAPETPYTYWNYNYASTRNSTKPSNLKKSIDHRSLYNDTHRLRPQFEWYRKLQAELAKYRKLELNYPQYRIPMAQLITPGKRSNSMPRIIEKLEQLNLINKLQRSDNTLYSGDLVDAIKRYQTLHGIRPDGLIGEKTINSMNISYGERVNQIKANLERARWVANEVSTNYILINIPGFKLFYYQDNAFEWSTEVIVGKRLSKTPIFTATMTYIDFFPTWTVPKSMSESIVKRIKNNPAYLKSHGYIVKNAAGQVLDADQIDWGSQNPTNFKYWLVRKPGEQNPMGKVKFMFPNSHAIYMHDTPTKQLFNSTSRTFSKGCIRVNNPFELSLRILEYDQGFTEYQQEKILSEGKPLTVFLQNPLDVFVMYWTAAPEPSGFYFYEDIYHRDDELIGLLNTPFDKLIASENRPPLKGNNSFTL